MRGNLAETELNEGSMGSIPAHAGEPAHRLAVRQLPRVYPLACGGTFRSASRRCIRRPGSIPAHAGEPTWKKRPRTPSRVYPRACGGTVAVLRCSTMRIRDNGSIPAHAGEPTGISDRSGSTAGLSPRMRGNQSLMSAVTLERGSIPAHAGEPKSRRPIKRC